MSGVYLPQKPKVPKKKVFIASTNSSNGTTHTAYSSGGATPSPVVTRIGIQQPVSVTKP